MNFLKTQVNLYASCHKRAASPNSITTPSSRVKFNFTNLFFFAFALLLLIPTSSYAKDHKSVDDILKLKTAPTGVVIEIVTGGADNLQWALPRAKDYIKKLRTTFPELHVAIVTHGAEQFALTKDAQASNKEVHQLVKSFGDDDVPVHVCETYAGWRGLNADDFPDYVNVAAAGPAQVNDYINLGYELILIKNK